MHSPVLLSYPFRPFFLMGAVFAVVAMALWLGVLHGLSWPGAPGNWVFWHIHEMVFGFVGAAIAGFLLTAIANWTGRPPVQGALLATLAAAWCCGRIAMAFPGAIPSWLVVVLALAFPLLLAGLVTRELTAAGNRRNYLLALLIAAFTLVDAVYLLGALGIGDQSVSGAIYLTPHLVIVLITVIGGRIIPAFTTNWLRARGAQRLPRVRPRLDGTAVLLVLAVGAADTVAPDHWLTGALAFGAALIHAIRLSGWCGLATRGEPLLAVLHFAYAWLVIGYGLLGASVFLPEIPRSSALHAITAGAMGTMVLAVMSRVSLGHTGRRLHANPITVVTYLLVAVAAVLRIVAPLVSGSYLALIDLSAIIWMGAFTGFLWEYGPILTRPRLADATSPGSPPLVTRPPVPRR
jgi:uncharacterized protein involved in response to NO